MGKDNVAEQRFDKAYWEQRWHGGSGDGCATTAASPPNPHLVRETDGLTPGTALDAGCGAGAEAVWLASRGWQVTAADISSAALRLAAERAHASGLSERVRRVEADLAVWEPGTGFDLVTTHYAHPAIPQLAFYERIASWVVPGGTLLVVGHLHAGSDDVNGEGPGHGDGHRPAEASVTAAAVAARLDDTAWEVVTADECHRTLTGHAGREVRMQDVVVRAVRRT